MKNKLIATIKIILLGLFFGCFASSTLFAQNLKDEEKQKLSKKIKALVSNYQKYAAFSENGESISEEYFREFKNLFLRRQDALVVNDLDPKKKDGSQIALPEYIKLAKEHHTGGVVIDSVYIEYFSIEKTKKVEQYEGKKDTYPYFVQLHVKKDFYGSYDYVEYLNYKDTAAAYLTFDLLLSESFNPKIVEIKPCWEWKEQLGKQRQKEIDQEKGKLTGKKKSLNNQIDSLRKEVKKIDKRIDSLNQIPPVLSEEKKEEEAEARKEFEEEFGSFFAPANKGKPEQNKKPSKKPEKKNNKAPKQKEDNKPENKQEYQKALRKLEKEKEEKISKISEKQTQQIQELVEKKKAQLAKAKNKKEKKKTESKFNDKKLKLIEKIEKEKEKENSAFEKKKKQLQEKYDIKPEQK